MPTIIGTDVFSHNDFTVPGGGPYQDVLGTPQRDTAIVRPGDPASLLISTIGTAIEHVQYQYSPTVSRSWRGFFFRQNTGEEPSSQHLVAHAFTPGFAVGSRMRYEPTANELSIQMGSSAQQACVITLDAWHWIEVILDVSGTTWTANWQVDGATQTPASEGGHSADVIEYVSLGYGSVATSSTRFSRHIWGTAVSTSDWLGEPVIRGYQRIYGPAQLSTLATDLYTTPTGSIVRLRHIYANNPSGSPVDFTFSIGANYSGEVLMDSPGGYWRLEESSGDVLDASVNDNTGTVSGSITRSIAGLPPAAGDLCYDFSGGEITVTDHATLQPPSNACTVECWVNFDVLPSVDGDAGNITFFAKTPYWMRLMRVAGVTYFHMYWRNDVAGGTWAGLLSTTAIQTGVTYHLASTYEGTTARLYVNGIQEAIDTGFTALVTDELGNLSIGSSALNGRLDEPAMYRTTLSADRIMAHYTAGADVAPAINIYDSYNIPAGGSLEWAYDHALAAGEKIQAYAEMDTVRSNTFEGGSDGTTLTVGNSGGASGDAFDAVTAPPAGGVCQFSNVSPYQGALSLRLATRGTAGDPGPRWTSSLGSPVDYFVRFFLKASEIPTGANGYILWGEGTTNNQIYGITLNTSGALSLRNAAGSAVVTSSTVLSANAWYRLELQIHGSLTVGYAILRIYADPAAAVGSFTEELNAGGATTWAFSTAATGNLIFTATQGGQTNWPTATGFVYFDALAVGASDWLGPALAPVLQVDAYVQPQ